MNSSKRVPVSSRFVLTNPICFLAFGFGSGLAPKAPGTFGTLAAIPLYLLAAKLSLPGYGILTVVLFILGVWLCGRCGRLLGVGDHSGIVWDEIVGFLITMTAIEPSFVSVTAGFVLFRIFDIWKPWPISYCDRHVHGGFGVMLDDALAGLFGWVSLKLLLLWFGR